VTVSGYNDWYLPAKNELEILYYNLKPSTTGNDNNSGVNPNAVPARASNYTTGVPGRTSSTLFQSGGSEAFSTVNYYWSSTENPSNPTAAGRQNFDFGVQNNNLKDFFNDARAIRRTYANAPVAIGAAFGGGYFAGQYQDGGITYNLIVAPVTDGTRDGQYGGATAAGIAWRTSDAPDTNPPSQNSVYGKTATDTFGAAGAATYPMFAWCYNNATGPNGNRTPGAGIGGFTDWYIPAQNELALLCYNLGPNWTTATDFKAGTGAQAFTTGGTARYWSATEDPAVTSGAIRQFFDTADQNWNLKSFTWYARAVRRVVA
jgi:hypothetical protein